MSVKTSRKRGASKVQAAKAQSCWGTQKSEGRNRFWPVSAEV